MVAEVAGLETPMPRPERASATTTIHSPADGLSVAKSTMEGGGVVPPARVAVRSPVRTVM